MKKQFKDIQRLTLADPGGIKDHLNKLFEEAGEVAADVNKLSGRKRLKKGETKEKVRENLIGELASVIQLAFCIAQKADINYQTMVAALDAENFDYGQCVDKEFIKK